MRTTWIPIGLAVAFSICGCKSSPTRDSSAAAAELSASTDTAIEASLELLDPRAVSQGESRALEFKLRNKTEERLDFFFTIDWFGANGDALPLASRGWNRLAIDSRVSQPVRIEPMPQDAKSWRLRFSSTERH